MDLVEQVYIFGVSNIHTSEPNISLTSLFSLIFNFAKPGLLSVVCLFYIPVLLSVVFVSYVGSSECVIYCSGTALSFFRHYFW